MTLMTKTEAAHTRFDRLCKLVKGATAPGLTLKEIGTCGALARELEADAPDPERVAMLAGRLNLETVEVEA